MVWVCLHFTIAAPSVRWTMKSLNLSLKVDFLFQSFLVITVPKFFCLPSLHIKNFILKHKPYFLMLCKTNSNPGFFLALYTLFINIIFSNVFIWDLNCLHISGLERRCFSNLWQYFLHHKQLLQRKEIFKYLFPQYSKSTWH